MVIFLCFRLLTTHTDTRLLHDGIMQLEGLRVERQWGVSLGPLPFFLARTGLSFVDLPDEARLALASARGVELGLYQVMQHPKHIDLEKITRETDVRMGQRGWERVLAVAQDNECVLVYAPKTMRSTHVMRICLAVLNESELVLVGAQINEEPLFDLVAGKSSQHPGQLACGVLLPFTRQAVAH